MLNHIFRKQIDDSLIVEKILIEQTINYADSVPDFRLVFGHSIDVTILNNPMEKRQLLHDTLMYDSETGAFAHFRHLMAENTSIRKKGYSINIYRPLSETENLIAEILIAIALVFISLMVTLVIANYFIARRVWIPFYRILAKLGQYQVDQAKPVSIPGCNIHEFNLLKDAIEKMSLKISLDYQNLKEFNENAAHEIQTPLAIIRSKLELLIQRENLDEDQLKMISNILEATHRISRLNQGLLLISKIENNQFTNVEPVDVTAMINNITASFEELILLKRIKLSMKTVGPCVITMNHPLAETLFTNLLANAIKHNTETGFINVTISQKSLTISNSGTKLRSAPDQLFERFKKSGSHADSIGLGLSIVKKIADLYHFKVSYTTEEEVHTITVVFENQLLQN
jgi:signal transduction histidine kinase